MNRYEPRHKAAATPLMMLTGAIARICEGGGRGAFLLSGAVEGTRVAGQQAALARAVALRAVEKRPLGPTPWRAAGSRSGGACVSDAVGWVGRAAAHLGLRPRALQKAEAPLR